MHKLTFTSIFLLIVLSACDSGEAKWQKTEKQAIKNVETLDIDAHHSYLQCYALDYQTKKECVDSLNDQYIITNEYKADPYYSKAFQYKAEKLGFIQFLSNHNLPCTGIDHGPQFIKSVNAYQVDCICGNSYLLQFNYDDKQWHLRKNN